MALETIKKEIGCVPFFNVLFAEFIVFDREDPYWKCRDRFFLDSWCNYPLLQKHLELIGKLDTERKETLFAHCAKNNFKGIEHAASPIGQAHTYAVGASIAAKSLYARTGNTSYLKEKIYAYVNDDSINAEVSQGAGRIAGHLGLNNLIVFYCRQSRNIAAEMREDTAMKYRAWNWNVIEVNGDSHAEIRTALSQATQEADRPTIIIGNTSQEHNLPMQVNIPEYVVNTYNSHKEELEGIVALRREEETAWANANPQKATEVDNWFETKTPYIPWDKVQQKGGDSTRSASGRCLELLSGTVKNMIVSSADLCSSDKTDGFLAHTTTITAKDFSGGFFQAGVSELTMACVCIGMALHGGLIVAMGTFLVFSDYIKPAMRMAALMELPIKFIYTHDSFRVGEDGATHEPIEQEAQLRLMECMKNAHGEDSVRVLRPCDAYATTQCWKIAMENNSTPTTLVLSRQNIGKLPVGINYEQIEKGAYPIIDAEKPDVILLASGSEVHTLVETSHKLNIDGYVAKVVACPSEGLFRSQTKEYQESLLPCGAKVFALTAGLPSTFERMVGSNGFIYGLSHFGYSAPAQVLDEKFGFTSDNIYKEVLKYLNDQKNEV